MGKKKKGKPMIRAGTYSITEVLDYLGEFEKDYDGHMVKMWSHRYQTFKHKGLICVECGLVGIHFVLEKHPYESGNGRYHFNLYALRENGQETLMTKDHIIPKAHGGKNHIDNYQTMCINCNQKKGSDYDKGSEVYSSESSSNKGNN